MSYSDDTDDSEALRLWQERLEAYLGGQEGGRGWPDAAERRSGAPFTPCGDRCLTSGGVPLVSPGPIRRLR